MCKLFHRENFESNEIVVDSHIVYYWGLEMSDLCVLDREVGSLHLVSYDFPFLRYEL
jgi:hypothetical protein